MEENIRNIELQDYKELVPLWKNTPGINLTIWDQPENFKRFLLQNKETSFVLEKDNKIIGSILCSFDGRHSYIYHFAVLPEIQRQGFGEKLLEKCLQKLKEQNILSAHLFVDTKNADAVSFFTKNGFALERNFIMLTKAVK